MNKEQDYASDTDESDDDFQPENLAGELSASEDEEAENSDANEENVDETDDTRVKLTKRKRVTKKVIGKKKLKTINTDESDDNDDENTTTSRRSTRQTETLHTNGKGKTLEKDELLSDEEDKSRTNALWADFLKDVNTTATSTISNIPKVDDKPSSVTNNISDNNKTSVRECQLQTQKSLTPKQEENNKVILNEVGDFAGEEAPTERVVDVSSIKENKAAVVKATKNQPFNRLMPGVGVKRTVSTAATGSSGGLGSLLNQLGKKKKMSVLEKSQMDWVSFKQSEGIDEQLQTFNKGKNGYLERQDFLQRTDLRQFEIEKNLRQSARRPL